MDARRQGLGEGESTATHPARRATKPTLNVILPGVIGGVRVSGAEIHLLQQGVNAVPGGRRQGTLLLSAAGVAQPGGNAVIAVGEFLDIDALVQGDGLVCADLRDDPLQAKTRGGSEREALR
ncbi:MAG: hypothetical protein VKO39_05505 [Cyanobacteriota bacterium]|nr:hypothetical protein [Cyanobacteriota bacterium]